MGSGFENLILFGLLSLMLLIGTLLRAKVKLFQDYLVPASIIGGLIGFAIVSTGWLKIGEWQITSSSFNWFLFHAFNISYISLLLTRPRGNQENTSKEVVRGGMWQTLIWTISLPAQALIGGAVIWLYNLATGNSLSEFIGMIVTHGYTQGPGQAYAFGTLWEKGGIADCATVGVIYAGARLPFGRHRRRARRPLVRPQGPQRQQDRSFHHQRIPDRHHGREVHRNQRTRNDPRLNHRHAGLPCRPRRHRLSHHLCRTELDRSPHQALL